MLGHYVLCEVESEFLYVMCNHFSCRKVMLAVAGRMDLVVRKIVLEPHWL